MCSSKIKPGPGVVMAAASVAEINGRPVLQPACNRVAGALQAGRPLKKTLLKSMSLPSSFTRAAASADVPLAADASLVSARKISPPVSPTSRPPKPVLKRSSSNGLTSSTERLLLPKSASPKPPSAPAVRKKSKSSGNGGGQGALAPLESLFLTSEREPGSIAAAQREQAMLVQAQRKMRIAHYGRTPTKLEGMVPVDASSNAVQEEKRCSFVTPNSDPLYIAYHDEEWGVPVHDDKMLFELLVLSGAQVGLDWSTILKKRNEFREAFADFDAETVSRFTERQMASISAEYGLDLGKVRGVVDNASRILEVMREFGSLDKYLWSFVNNNPIMTNYKSCRKIPVKTSKSESISKDMVRRGFRFVGPTVVHSFMQAAGLTNDHLISCPRHHHCSSLIISSN